MSETVASLCCCAPQQQFGCSVFAFRYYTGFSDLGIIAGRLVAPSQYSYPTPGAPAYSFPTQNPITFQYGRLFTRFVDTATLVRTDNGVVTSTDSMSYAESIGPVTINPTSTGPLFLPNFDSYTLPKSNAAQSPPLFYNSGPFWLNTSLNLVNYSQRGATDGLFNSLMITVSQIPTLNATGDAVTSATYSFHGGGDITTGPNAPDLYTLNTTGQVTVSSELDYDGLFKNTYYRTRYLPAQKKFADPTLDGRYQYLTNNGRQYAQQATLNQFAEGTELGDGPGWNSFDIGRVNPGMDGSIQFESSSGGPTIAGLNAYQFVPSYFIAIPRGVPALVMCISEIVWTGPYTITEYVVMSDWSLVDPMIVQTGSANGKLMIPPPGTPINPDGSWGLPTSPMAFSPSLYQSQTMYPIGRLRRVM